MPWVESSRRAPFQPEALQKGLLGSLASARVVSQYGRGFAGQQKPPCPLPSWGPCSPGGFVRPTPSQGWGWHVCLVLILLARYLRCLSAGWLNPGSQRRCQQGCLMSAAEEFGSFWWPYKWIKFMFGVNTLTQEKPLVTGVTLFTKETWRSDWMLFFFSFFKQTGMEIVVGKSLAMFTLHFSSLPLPNKRTRNKGKMP